MASPFKKLPQELTEGIVDQLESTRDLAAFAMTDRGNFEASAHHIGNRRKDLVQALSTPNQDPGAFLRCLKDAYGLPSETDFENHLHDCAEGFVRKFALRVVRAEDTVSANALQSIASILKMLPLDKQDTHSLGLCVGMLSPRDHDAALSVVVPIFKCAKKYNLPRQLVHRRDCPFNNTNHTYCDWALYCFGHGLAQSRDQSFFGKLLTKLGYATFMGDRASNVLSATFRAMLP